MIYIDCHLCLEVGIPPSRAEDGSLICRRHSDAIWRYLDRIRMMAAHIDGDFLASSHEPRSDMGTKSLPPCNLDPIVVTDPRSQYHSKRDLVSAPRVLGQWCMAVGDMMLSPPSVSTVPEMIWYLKLNLVWMQRQPAIVRFARHIAAVHNSLRRVTSYD